MYYDDFSSVTNYTIDKYCEPPSVNGALKTHLLDAWDVFQIVQCFYHYPNLLLGSWPLRIPVLCNWSLLKTKSLCLSIQNIHLTIHNPSSKQQKKVQIYYYFTFVKITPQRTLNSIYQKGKTTFFFMYHSSEPKKDFQKYSRLSLKRLCNSYILSFKTNLLKSFKIWNTQILNFML